MWSDWSVRYEGAGWDCSWWNSLIHRSSIMRLLWKSQTLRIYKCKSESLPYPWKVEKGLSIVKALKLPPMKRLHSDESTESRWLFVISPLGYYKFIEYFALYFFHNKSVSWKLALKCRPGKVSHSEFSPYFPLVLKKLTQPMRNWWNWNRCHADEDATSSRHHTPLQTLPCVSHPCLTPYWFSPLHLVQYTYLYLCTKAKNNTVDELSAIKTCPWFSLHSYLGQTWVWNQGRLTTVCFRGSGSL